MILDSGVIVAGDGARLAAGFLVLIPAVVGLPWAVVAGWGLIKDLLEGGPVEKEDE